MAARFRRPQDQLPRRDRVRIFPGGGDVTLAKIARAFLPRRLANRRDSGAGARADRAWGALISNRKGSMQRPVMVSRKDDAFKPVLALAHQFDCVHGNDPMPQIMIRLIGCHIETRRAVQMEGERGKRSSARR